MEDILRHSPVGIVILDSEGKFAFVNKKFIEITGAKSEKAYEGVNALTLESYVKSGLVKHLKDGLRGKGFELDGIKVTSVIGNKTTIRRYMGVPIKDNKGKVRQLLILIEDVTEHRKLLDEIKKSEELYRDLFDNAPDMYHIFDKAGVIIDCNETEVKALGYKTKKEIIGKTIFDLIDESEHDLVRKTLNSVVEKGGVENLDRTYTRRDGSKIKVNLNIVPAYDKQRKLIGYRSIIRDVTEKRKLEGELMESEERYRQLVENMNDGISVVDEKGRITFTNKKFAEMLEYEPNELIGKSTLPLYTPESRMIVEQELKKRKQDTTSRYAIDYITKSGRIVHAIKSRTPIFNKDGEYAGSFAVATDITDMMRLQEELNLSEKRAIAAKNYVQSILDGINEGIVVLDKNYSIISYNEAFKKSLRIPRKKVMGQTCYKIIHDHSTPCTQCIVRDTFRTGHFFESYHHHEDPNGKSYHETKSYPLKDADGSINHAIYIFRDVTEQKQVEEEIRNLNEFKQKILDNAGISINIIDLNGNIINSNRGSEQIFGWEEAEIVGRHHRIFFGKKDQTEIKDMLSTAANKKKFKKDVKLVRKDGREFPANLAITTVEDEKGQATAFIEIVEDLTERKKAEQLIKEQVKKLKALDTMKTEYFYSASHELKTPLTTISGLTKALASKKIGNVSSQQEEALNLILHESNRLTKSVQKILDLSKIDAGKMVYHKSQVDFKEVADEVMGFMDVIAKSKEIRMIKKLADTPPINADKERISLVLDNIISNALKFTSKKGTVIVKTTKDGNSLLVKVSDTGPGIPESDLDRVFERYYQVQSGAENVGGTGLGLVICKKIVEGHGGRIWVESRLGEGSTFNFTIPFYIQKA